MGTRTIDGGDDDDRTKSLKLKGSRVRHETCSRDVVYGARLRQFHFEHMLPASRTRIINATASPPQVTQNSMPHEVLKISYFQFKLDQSGNAAGHWPAAILSVIKRLEQSHHR